MALNVRIQKRCGDFQLDAAFSAECGEALALLGASGCGKSMTLKCIAGIERPDRGRITLDGAVLFDSEQRIHLPPQKRRIGYLFQQYALFPHMTVAENIAVCLPRRERCAARVQELIAMLRLEGTEKLRPRQLSGGQQQRTALARILASKPQAILLDEPFAALDGYLKWQLEPALWAALDRFRGPVIWVSHDQGEVCRNCAKVCVLEKGRSAPVTSVRALMEHPDTVSAARLSGCRNCVPVQPGPDAGCVSVPAWHAVLRTAAPWREGVAALGIRAGHVRPAVPGEENVLLCRTVRAAEEEGSAVLAMLHPEGAAPDAPPLWMALDRARWEALPDKQQIAAALPPEHLLLLEETRRSEDVYSSGTYCE